MDEGNQRALDSCRKASGMRGKADEPFKSRKGFGYRVRHGQGPATHQSRDLLSNKRYTEAVLNFLRCMKVGKVREGAICK